MECVRLGTREFPDGPLADRAYFGFKLCPLLSLARRESLTRFFESLLRLLFYAHAAVPPWPFRRSSTAFTCLRRTNSSRSRSSSVELMYRMDSA